MDTCTRGYSPSAETHRCTRTQTNINTHWVMIWDFCERGCVRVCLSRKLTVVVLFLLPRRPPQRFAVCSHRHLSLRVQRWNLKSVPLRESTELCIIPAGMMSEAHLPVGPLRSVGKSSSRADVCSAYLTVEAMNGGAADRTRLYLKHWCACACECVWICLSAYVHMFACLGPQICLR